MRSLSGASLTSKLSIGNMGFSEPLCSTVNFGVQQSIISCPYGSIKKIHSFGIHPKVTTSTNMNIDEDLTGLFDIFKPRSKGTRCINKPTDLCNKYLDFEKAQKSIE